MFDGLKLLLPFPYKFGGELYNGSILEWPDFCINNCKTSICDKANSEIRICSYGYNYVKYGEFILGGFLLKKYDNTKPRNKLIKAGVELIPNKLLDNLKTTITYFENSIAEDIDKHKNEVIQQYVNEDVYKIDFLNPLKQDMLKGFSYVHDYKQINSTIRQNINVIIEQKYEGDNIDEKLRKASTEEIAIYKASDILTEKLNTAKFLINPEWLLDSSLCKNNKFYKIVHKYMRLYDNRAKLKKVNIRIIGASHIEVFANPQAISVIPHTLIDNAIKYSPKDSEITIIVNDINEGINFQVNSYGPKMYVVK